MNNHSFPFTTKLGKIIALFSMGLLMHACSPSKKETVVTQNQSNGLVNSEKTDTALKVVTTLKPYKKVITEKAITDTGLFSVHQVDGKYFWEIPDSLLNKDILIVNRISKAAAENRPLRGFFGYAGDQVGEHVIRICEGPGNKLFIKKISFLDISRDSTENGLYRAVLNSNLQPIVAAFPIISCKPDSSAVIIDVTDFVNKDNNLLFFNARLKRPWGIGALQPDRSFIVSMQAFPTNVEIRTVKTYQKGEDYVTYELNSSVVILPASPMKPRYADQRVGYFAQYYNDFDMPQGVDETGIITRWRLEPRAEDIERYLKGEIVQPQKPIVFYIDPATPKKWVPYLIKGVNDWQTAFEKAGFKNAISAREAPSKEENPSWSLEDARYSAIVYKPSSVPNAMGPHVHDPRSGEILESHVYWYHNVTRILHDWYMVQAGAIDAQAQKMNFSDELMGQLIRFVASHEVGHTLGLAHNFGASSTIPVDSLRSKRYVELNGFCPSIMDYARFNYVAQPEDGVSQSGIFPRIGIYDEWAIEWGYKWLPGIETKQSEKDFMNQWIIERLKKDNRLWFLPQAQVTLDPRSQAESIGDDAIKASTYGILNLKRIFSQLINWTKEPNSSYNNLIRMQEVVYGQFERYLFHVATYIGGVELTIKTVEQPGNQFNFTPRKLQKLAMKFLQDQLFDTPEWLINRDIFNLVGGTAYAGPIALQKNILERVMSHAVFQLLLFNESIHPGESYKIDELLTDLEKGIWKELSQRKPIDQYRRNLQKVYVDQLISRLQQKSTSLYSNNLNIPLSNYLDIMSILRAHIQQILKKIDVVLHSYTNNLTRWHLEDIRMRLAQGLKEEKGSKEIAAPVVSQPVESLNLQDLFKTMFRQSKMIQGCTGWGIFGQTYSGSSNDESLE